MVLVRKETTAEDIHGMKSSVGVLTEQVRAYTHTESKKVPVHSHTPI